MANEVLREYKGHGVEAFKKAIDEGVTDERMESFVKRCQSEKLTIGDFCAYLACGGYVENFIRNLVGDEVYDVAWNDDEALQDEATELIKKEALGGVPDIIKYIVNMSLSNLD